MWKSYLMCLALWYNHHMKHFKKLYSLYIDNPASVPAPQKDSKPSFVSKFSTIVITIALVILSSWGITVATTDTFPTAKEDFSAIGIVSSIESTHIIITNAQGSDDSGNTEYNINITHIDKIETNTYQDISIDDIQLNNKVIVQGKTTGSVFFATRLILFPTESITPIEQTATSTATTTEDSIATSTDETASSTDSEEPTQEPDSSTEQAPTDTETQPTTEEASTTDTTSTDTPEVTSSSTESTDDTTATSTVIDTVTNIIEEGIDTVSNTIQNIINVVTGGNEEPAPAPEPQPEPTPEPETVPEPQS